MHPRLSVSYVIARPALRLARRPASAASRETDRRCRLPARRSPPRPAPPYSYSLVSRETCEDTQQPADQEREDEIPTAPGLTLSLRSLVSVLAALVLRRRRRPRGLSNPRSCGDDLFATRVFHVKPPSIVLSPAHAPAHRPGGLSTSPVGRPEPRFALQTEMCPTSPLPRPHPT